MIFRIYCTLIMLTVILFALSINLNLGYDSYNIDKYNNKLNNNTSNNDKQ